MKSSACSRRLATVLLVIAALVACTRRQDAPLSATVREIDAPQRRLVPSDGGLLRSLEPVRTPSGVRTSWEIQTKWDAATYFQWLKGELGPSYHPTSQTDSSLSLVKEMEGDSYMVGVTSRKGVGGFVIEVQFVAIPD